jgi:hypothetical protein
VEHSAGESVGGGLILGFRFAAASGDGVWCSIWGCAIPFKDGHTPLADFFLWCGGQGRPALP